jgi:poly-gamma-glutamate synthesis protein (capsule biosynthesis protein)
MIDEAVLRRVREADLAIVNVECPLTTAERRAPKTGPKLKSDPEWAVFLKDAGFELATLANNHIYDYGRQGFEDTIGACAEVELETVGAGATLEQSQRTSMRTIGGKKLDVVNVAENEWCAATSRRGGAHPMDTIGNARTLRSAAENADFVLVVAHGGSEFTPYPSPRTVDRYRFFIENGADAVIAHHPHVVQGYEIHQGAPIVYSLGNFLFPPVVRHHHHIPGMGWFTGMGASVEFPFSGPDSLELFPFRQCDDGLKIVSFEPERQTHFAKQLARLSEPIGDFNKLIRLRKEPLRTQANTLLWYLSHGALPLQVVRRVLNRLGVLEYLVRRRDRKNFLRLQILRTESHRDLLIETLQDLFDEEE